MSVQISTTTIQKSSYNMVILAWIVILMSLDAPAIIYRFFVPVGASERYIPYWLVWVQIILLASFWLAAQFWSRLKPLRGLALALLALILGHVFVQPAFLQSSLVSNWLQEASWGMKQIIIYGSKLIPVALMALTLIGSGIGRRELFLSRGNPRALAGPTPFLPGLKESQPWNKVARSFLPFFVVIMVIVLWLQIRPDASQFSSALIFLPAIILASALNAFSEEFEFRSMLMSRLGPVVGGGQAILMTSVVFGLAHYGPSNNPNGLIGAVLAGYLGWVAAKSMVETRGMVWAFLLHFLADFVIFAFFAMAVV